MEMPLTLGADGFSLRQLTLEDWPIEAELSRHADVVRWTYYPADLDEGQARRRIEEYLARAAQGLVRRYVILDGENRIGICGVGQLTATAPEVFYALTREGRGRGAATAAVRALCSWLHQDRPGQVALETVEGNAASEQVARRSGFVLASSQPDEHRGEPVVLHRWLWPATA